MDLPPNIALRFAACPASGPARLDCLAEHERVQLGTFGSAKRQREFALGRTTARALLAKHLAVEAAAVPLRVAEDGAPEVEGAALHVSIAHASTPERSVAAVAVAPHVVGVDVEVIRPRRPDLFRFLLHPDEVDLFESLPREHDAAQVLLWTLKEAVLKARRSGLRTSPKAIRLGLDAADGTAVARIQNEAWALRYVERDGCFLAVAFPG